MPTHRSPYLAFLQLHAAEHNPKRHSNTTSLNDLVIICDVLTQQQLKLTFAKLTLKQIKREITGARKIIVFLERVSQLLVTDLLAASSTGLHTNSCYVNYNNFYLFCNSFWQCLANLVKILKLRSRVLTSHGAP